MFFWTVKSMFGHHEHLWDCASHKPPNLYLFFSFIYLFWTNDAVVLFSLSTFAEQVSNILQFPSVYNFPHHLHTYFLIYTDDKILPNKFVLKSCLILVACNSDFFWLSIWWMTTQLVAFDNPCLCWRKECSCLSGLFYKLYYSFPLLCLLSFKYFSTHKKNVYEQATVYGVSVFSEMILWTKETFSFYSNALHLESNLKHRVFHIRCKVWKLGNITWGIFLHISPSFS